MTVFTTVLVAIGICVAGTVAACALCAGARRAEDPYLAPMPSILSQKPRERDRSQLA